jgi:hypothetical protein
LPVKKSAATARNPQIFQKIQKNSEKFRKIPAPPEKSQVHEKNRQHTRKIGSPAQNF